MQTVEEIATVSLLAPGVHRRRQRLARIVKAITMQIYVAERAAARREVDATTPKRESLVRARARCLWRLANVVVVRTLRWMRQGYPLQDEEANDVAEVMEDAEQLLAVYFPGHSDWRLDRARYMWSLLRKEVLDMPDSDYSGGDLSDGLDDGVATLHWAKLRLQVAEVLALGGRGHGRGPVEDGDDSGVGGRPMGLRRALCSVVLCRVVAWANPVSACLTCLGGEVGRDVIGNSRLHIFGGQDGPWRSAQ